MTTSSTAISRNGRWPVLGRAALLELCDPRFMAALTAWNNGPLPDQTRTLGPQWVAWIMRNCRLGEGDSYNQPPDLTPEQQALLWKLGEITDEMLMRYATAVISLAKGGGKTPLGGWLTTLSLRGPRVVCKGCRKCHAGRLPNGNPHGARRVSPDVLIMAASFDQADMILDEARVSFDADGTPLTGTAETTKGLIELKGERGRARRIPATPKRADGSKATDLFVDEAHEFDTELRERAYDVASGGTAKREDGLVCLLSTAGSDLTTLWGRIISRFKRGEGGSDELVVIMEADDGLDPLNDDDVIEGIKQANPLAARGVASVRKLLKKFREMPIFRAKRYYWNKWTSADESWLPVGAWDACKTGPEVPWIIDPSLPTWVGADMALKRDSAAVVIVQRRPDGKLQTSSRIWYPDGELIDQTECDQYLYDIAAGFNLKWIAADEAWWPTLRSLERGSMDDPDPAKRRPPLPIFRMPQQGRNMIVAYSMLYRAIVSRILVHDGAPDYSDQIASAVPVSADRGWTLRKGKARRRIDSAPALAGAIFATEQPEPETEKPLPRSAVY